MSDIETQFNATFELWSIRLPLEDLNGRRRGKIVQAGWAIWYLFGLDESGEYLDYYASHRMTNDRHVRIYSNGICEALPVIQEFYLTSEDPDEDARLAAEYYEENRRVAEILEAKGFGLRGDEPVAVQINRSLQLHNAEEIQEDV